MNCSTPRFNILYQKRETPKKRNNKFRNDNSDFIKGLQLTKKKNTDKLMLSHVD